MGVPSTSPPNVGKCAPESSKQSPKPDELLAASKCLRSFNQPAPSAWSSCDIRIDSRQWLIPSQTSRCVIGVRQIGERKQLQWQQQGFNQRFGSQLALQDQKAVVRDDGDLHKDMMVLIAME